ncbi:MAG: DMT family transporter [Oceanospirillaceae bacterium]|nr:DMT family transporter [Oceanospirillaceae bacterium]
MNWMLIAMAVVAGTMLPMQGALNARLGALMLHPMQATLVSYIGGTIACVFVLLIAQASIPDYKRLASIDWYLYLGGFLGAVFVSGMLYLMPRIGIANMLAAAILGQLVMSVIFDHYGLAGVKIEINSSRIIGVFLLLAGVYFLQR